MKKLTQSSTDIPRSSFNFSQLYNNFATHAEGSYEIASSCSMAANMKFDHFNPGISAFIWPTRTAFSRSSKPTSSNAEGTEVTAPLPPPSGKAACCSKISLLEVFHVCGASRARLRSRRAHVSKFGQPKHSALAPQTWNKSAKSGGSPSVPCRSTEGETSELAGSRARAAASISTN